MPLIQDQPADPGEVSQHPQHDKSCPLEKKKKKFIYLIGYKQSLKKLSIKLCRMTIQINPNPPGCFILIQMFKSAKG